MKYLRKFVVIVLILMIGIGNLSAFAQSSFPPHLKALEEEIRKSIPEKALKDCKETLVQVFDTATLEFMQFIETNFQNKSSTSSLVNIAIARYSQYKNYLKDTAAMLMPQYSSVEDVKEYETEYTNYVKCLSIRDSYIDVAKEHMIRHIRNNNAQRKTTILLEKFKAINSKLRDLNMEVAEMYAFFAALKNKLPGFLKECLSS